MAPAAAPWAAPEEAKAMAASEEGELEEGELELEEGEIPPEDGELQSEPMVSGVLLWPAMHPRALTTQMHFVRRSCFAGVAAGGTIL